VPGPPVCERSRVQGCDPGVSGEGAAVGPMRRRLGEMGRFGAFGKGAGGILLPFAKAALADIACKFNMLKFFEEI